MTDVVMPDGTVIQDVPDGVTQSQLATKYQAHLQAPVSRDNGTGSTKPMGDVFDAVGEPVASLATGLVATPVAGIAGLLSMPFTNDPASVVRKVSSALTYEPRTRAGTAVNDAIAYPFQKLAQGADYLGGKSAELTGSPAIGAAVNTAVQAAPALLLRGRLGRAQPSAASSAVAPAEEASAISSAAERPAALGKVPAGPPSLDELRSQAKAAYKKADDAGITISSTSIDTLKAKAETDLKDAGLDPTLHPATTAALKRLSTSQGDLKLSELDTLRQVANDARSSASAGERRVGGKLVDQIDEYMNSLGPSDVTSGDPAQVSALTEARALYTRQKKAETIKDLFDRAELNAPNFSGSGMENALRTEFRALAKNKTRMRSFNPEEQAAIKKVALGGPLENSLRQLGKLAPTGVVSSGFSAGAGFAMGGPTGAVALPALGAASRYAATRMTLNNAAKADALMRRGPIGNSLKPKRVKNALAQSEP